MSPVTRGRVMHRFANIVECPPRSWRCFDRTTSACRSRRRRQLAMIVDVIRYYAGAVDKFSGYTIPGRSGWSGHDVFASRLVWWAITACNFPQHRQLEGCAGAAAGNTVVLKPASLTPVPRLARHRRLRAGCWCVLNVVPGPRCACWLSRMWARLVHRVDPQWPRAKHRPQRTTHSSRSMLDWAASSACASRRHGGGAMPFANCVQGCVCGRGSRPRTSYSSATSRRQR